MRFRLIRVPLAIVFAVALGGRAGMVRGQDAVTDVARILDRYAQGDPTLSSLSNLIDRIPNGLLLGNLRGAGRAWIDAGRGAEQDYRRLAAATFVLDIVYQQKQQTGAVSAPLVEWARDQLRETKKPLPAERDWLVATLGLFESSGEFAALNFQLVFARTRFKGEARFLMADAWLQKAAIPVGFRHNELISGNPYFPYGPVSPTGPAATPPRVETSFGLTAPEWFAMGIDPYLPDFKGSVSDGSFSFGQFVPALTIGTSNYQPDAPKATAPEISLWRARDDYEHARGTAAVAVEAELRLGTLDLAYAKAKDAIDHFQKALKRASSPDLKYLAQLLLGRADEALDRWADAEAAYRAALAEVPGAPAAGHALVVLLKLKDRAAEAEAIRQTINPAVADPCLAFSAGDLIPTAALIAQLREAISRY